MPRYIKVILMSMLALIALVVLVVVLLAQKEVPEQITYGLSFNAPYVAELGLDPGETLDAILHDLGVRHLRLSAHWPLIEPTKDRYTFTWMDAQLKAVGAVNGEVIFGVGRRLPRWPECHIPPWAGALSWDEQKIEILEYITEVVNRYKDDPTITHWQVENEPYLGVFARDFCGELDENFLIEEIALVKALDPSRPVLVTDSGNLGTWGGAYRNGDSFGTSVYVYFWNPELGQFKTILPPWYYRVKEGLMKLLYGEKESFLIELSAEPWLLEPVTDVPVDVQYSRMDREKFIEIIDYAKDTRFARQYVWGGEWWYWLKEMGYPDMWEYARELYRK